MRPSLLLFGAIVALLAVPAVAAGTQDPATYPDGVAEVSHTQVLDRADFTVTALVDGAEGVTVTVCRFSSVEAAGPDVCYMNLAAAPGADGWAASTGAVEHPAWRDGWVIGYKVTAKTASGELHAPDRLAPNGEPDYYRLVVGEPDVEGSAVVEDSPVGQAAAPAAAASKDAPFPWSVALLGLAAAALAARRR